MEASVVLKLPSDAVRALTERYPTIIREMALMMGRRLRAAHDSVTSLAVDPVEARLASTLLRLGERDGERSAKGVSLPFHLTRQTLADMSGTTVETAIRTLGRWLKDGFVREDAARLVLVDIEALRATADNGPDRACPASYRCRAAFRTLAGEEVRHGRGTDDIRADDRGAEEPPRGDGGVRAHG